FSNPSTLSAESVRFDHTFTPRVTVFGRYNVAPSHFDQRGGAFSAGAVLSATNALSSSVHTLTAGVTQQIGQRITNEIRANFSRQRTSIKYEMDDFGGAVALQDSQVFPPGFSSADSAMLFLITGVGEYAQGKIGTAEQRQVNLIDNFSLLKAGH